jgi:ArsR family metal-binding transcriptional regulator
MDKPNLEYQELIDYLTTHKFYGNITLYFQNGIIDHNEITERNTAKEIKEKMSTKRSRSVLHISKKGEENGKAKHIQESQAYGRQTEKEGNTSVHAGKP